MGEKFIPNSAPPNTPTSPVESGVSQALEGIHTSVGGQLENLKLSLPGGAAEATQLAVNLGVTTATILAPIAITVGAIQTMFGYPPWWVKKLTLQE